MKLHIILLILALLPIPADLVRGSGPEGRAPIDSREDIWFCGDGLCESYLGEDLINCPDDCRGVPVIMDAVITFGPYKPVPSHGDAWFFTWMDDGSADGIMYTTWGDGCGMGLNFGDEGCQEWDWDTDISDAGMAPLTGTVPELSCIPSGSGCETHRDVPDGISGYPHTATDDKPSSILALDDRIYFAGHGPQRKPDKGYIAYSDNGGNTWTMASGTPWQEEYPNSPRSYFRIPMFINMGKNYEYNTDGYVYILGIGWGWDWDDGGDGRVYLARVPKEFVGNYSSYEYFTGLNGSSPMWSPDESQAGALDGLIAYSNSSAIYHPGIDRYLFLTSFGLFEAPNPWGPWILVDSLYWWADDLNWYGVDTMGLIPKDTGPDYVYFSVSGRNDVLDYGLMIGKITFTLREDRSKTASLPVSLDTGIPATGDAAPRLRLTPTPTPTPASECANYIYVASPECMTLQAALDRVCDGGRIVAGDGTYTGKGNRNLNFNGKAVTLESENGRDRCFLDCELKDRGFVFNHGEGSDSLVKGFTIFRGYSVSVGGGIFCWYSSPTITDCVITSCIALSKGGGIDSYNSNPVIVDCILEKNSAGFAGGGVCSYQHSDVVLQNCDLRSNESKVWGGGILTEVADLYMTGCEVRENIAMRGGGYALHFACQITLKNNFIEQNIAYMSGAGIYHNMPCWWKCFSDISFLMENCTFRENMVLSAPYPGYGGAIHSKSACPDATIRNCIFWEDYASTGQEFALQGPGHLIISHSDLQGGQPGFYVDGEWYIEWLDGMIDSDPLFAEGPMGRSYLSQAAAGQMSDSPCLDSGADLSQNVCFETTDVTRCLNAFSTRTDHENDTGQVDMGAHYFSGYFLPGMSILGIIITMTLFSLFTIRRRK